MRRFLLLLAVAGCSGAEPPATLAFAVSGHLEDASIKEASGLARSGRETGLLWIINDNGAQEIVHAVDSSGARRGEFKLKNSDNKDWEDLSSFRRDGESFLMVADIGDNEARRKKRTLYFVREPAAQFDAKAKTDWAVEYRYPDGPRDAEAAAIDVADDRVLILSKRDIPPQLYAVPLQPGSHETLIATPLGAVTSLPRPTRQDVEFAPKTDDWHWQPVGMDISEDGLAAVILTYSAVYYYRRSAEQDWVEALASRPLRVSLGNFKNAEAIAFSDYAREVVVTGENTHSLIIKVDLAGAPAP